MDHNILLMTIFVFLAVLVAVRFMMLLFWPTVAAMIILAVVYSLSRRRAPGDFRKVHDGDAQSYTAEFREEGLSLKYSSKMIELKKNLDEIKASCPDDRAMSQIVEELAAKLEALFSETFDLCRKASRSESFASTVVPSEIEARIASNREKAAAASDPDLAAEYRKNIGMLEQTLADFGKCDKLLKLADLEISRVENFFDIIKLKIAGLFLNRSFSSAGEIDEIARQLKSLFEEIDRLKENISRMGA